MQKGTLSLAIIMILSSGAIHAEEQIRNSHFKGNMDGWWNAGANIATESNEACIDIKNPGKNSWDIILGHSGIGLEQGQKYQVSFDAYANIDTEMKALIQHEGPPYTHYFLSDVGISTDKQSYTFDFVHELDSDADTEFQFQLGAQKEGIICVDNVSVVGKPFVKVATKMPIRANQVGFLPQSDKFIFVENTSTTPLKWTLISHSGISLDLGKTEVFGLNKASGEHIHRVNLSNYTDTMKGLTIEVGDDVSYPFDIRNDVYSKLKLDALSYFYQNRSGIEIKPEFVQREDLARPGGHMSDTATCFDKVDSWGNKWPGCDLTIDAIGGWYDAGDHGKYTVNSGISTWTLLNLFERGKFLENKSLPFSESKVKIPEATNGVNPLLSEARWNIEFMLAMQVDSDTPIAVPVGNQSASKNLKLTEINARGLAFHKIADESWTGMPLPPHKDTQKRYVGYPTTAASLNLAAIGAQCARIWKDIDSDFSQLCLDSATKAWNAANQHQDIYAYDNFTGSGPYDDIELSDERYWAAAELFITTNDEAYKEVLVDSRHYLEVPKGNINADGDMYWQYIAPAGTVSLAVVPNSLDNQVIEQARKNIIKTAESYTKQVANEGYNIPYTVEEYSWGSNSNLVNRSIFLIYAHDFSNDVRYIKAAASAMDYILGGNPMNISYVTGYGTKPAENPHHRFWAYAADESSPKPAPGALIGGPNSVSFSDPIAAVMKGKCVGQTCYSDNIGAWTLNEITINWNAPLVWVTSALDEGQLD
ncbi:glycoside hydrolase family 9 protein [Vibrio cyclitrophicus]|uniref:glycoside hydrolase family 9 protein n=1 Tax=Vibrio cyclitrophicus TaxID=47951 RepID=UPI0002EB35F5|nr:glycoside hydrolase family 9 protein [Vibrio cyclitrophicus]OBT09807.1 glycosyl hydrolase [Vibrio cyclitrophicus]OEE05735.1 glycosyl hydrolase [Vibrio cyclitrophicus ZF264]